MWAQVFGVPTFCSEKEVKQMGHFSESLSLLLSEIRVEQTFEKDVDGVAAPPK
jgi:hypothetical protein